MERHSPARLSQAAYALHDRAAAQTLVSVKHTAPGAGRLHSPPGPWQKAKQWAGGEGEPFPNRRQSCLLTISVLLLLKVSLAPFLLVLFLNVLLKVLPISPHFFPPMLLQSFLLVSVLIPLQLFNPDIISKKTMQVEKSWAQHSLSS